MKISFLKLPLVTVLSAGLLLTVATGTTLASEESGKASFWDHQELVVSAYEDPVPDFSSAEVPADLADLKQMVKSGSDVASIQVSADVLSGQITVSRPVDLLIDGYDTLSAADQKKIKIVVKMPDSLDKDASHVMTIQGLPEERVEIKSLGSVSLYVSDSTSDPVDETVPGV